MSQGTIDLRTTDHAGEIIPGVVIHKPESARQRPTVEHDLARFVVEDNFGRDLADEVERRAQQYAFEYDIPVEVAMYLLARGVMVYRESFPH